MLKKEKEKSFASWEMFGHNIQIIRWGKKYHQTDIRAGTAELSHAATSASMRSWYNNTGSNAGPNSPLFSLRRFAPSALPLAVCDELAVPACAFPGLHHRLSSEKSYI